MGRKTGKRSKLTWRVVKDIVAILGISLFISAMCGFFYFKEVISDQRISDEKAKQQQLVNQLTFMTEDIGQYAENILVDEQLQELLDETAQDEYEKSRKYDRISRRLMFYSSLRPHIYHICLAMKDGSCYESSYQRWEIREENAYLKEETLSPHFQEETDAFSGLYTSGEGSPQKKLICYRVPLLDKYHYGEQIGCLYMEIDLDYFLSQVEWYGEGYDTICLADRGQNFLYAKDRDGIVQNFLESEKSKETKEVFPVKEGYLIWEEIETAGWKLYTMIPKSEVWQSSQFVLKFFMISFLFSLGMVILFSTKIMERIVRPVVRLSEQMEREDYGNLGEIEIVRTKDEIEMLYRRFCSMIKKIQEEERVRMEQEKKKKEMEFAVMHSQISPHYLYNVLNTVMFLAAVEKNKKIAEIVRALIYTLQETIDIGSDELTTTLEKEIQLVNAYLDIQKYRYAGKFKSCILCGDDLKEYIVPKTIVQPLVENAIVHGILPSERAGTVTVRSFQREEMLVIEVEDDGIGIREEEIRRFETEEKKQDRKDERRHIGMENVKERIRYLYGETYGMKIERRKEGGTRIWLYLPLIRKGEDG